MECSQGKLKDEEAEKNNLRSVQILNGDILIDEPDIFFDFPLSYIYAHISVGATFQGHQKNYDIPERNVKCYF